jgi:hypothetical protein
MTRFLWVLFALAIAVTVWGSTLESSIEIISHSDLVNGDARENLRFRQWRQFPSGTATDQADIIYHATGSIASGASSTLCLSDGSMLNGLGLAASYAHVLAVTMVNTATTTLILGGHATKAFDPWGSTISMVGSAAFHMHAPVSDGWDVGASDTLKILNSSGGTGTYEIWILGKSS